MSPAREEPACSGPRRLAFVHRGAGRAVRDRQRMHRGRAVVLVEHLHGGEAGPAIVKGAFRIRLDLRIPGPIHRRVVGRDLHHVMISRGNIPVTCTAGAGAGRHVPGERVPTVGDPENRRIAGVRIIFEREVIVVRGVRCIQQPRDVTWICRADHRGSREDTDVGVKFVVRLRPVLQKIAMADGLVANVAGQSEANG